MRNKQVILFATHQFGPEIQKRFQAIASAVDKTGDLYILYHQSGEEIPESVKKYRHFIFDNSLLYKTGYNAICNTLVPGSNHFPLLQFAITYPDYHHYWYIEYDVRFSGDWKNFFSSFYTNDTDFITTYVQGFNKSPDWPWWNCLYHPDHNIRPEEQIRSFNPVYRISNRALFFIHKCLLDKWQGHHENLLPTLLRLNGFTIQDLSIDHSFCSDETFRWRPSVRQVEDKKNKLWHPVKITLTPNEEAEKGTHFYISYVNNYTSYIIKLDTDATGQFFLLADHFSCLSESYRNVNSRSINIKISKTVVCETSWQCVDKDVAIILRLRDKDSTSVRFPKDENTFEVNIDNQTMTFYHVLNIELRNKIIDVLKT